ncbi:Lsr2 family DNA-binding protein [Actinomycetospora flava]|uniref:Lsr2 family DNA-binding protein n=1 Tax=Actinomycetospora flava TaxID=3129232 RepID=UPI0040388499
MPAPAVDEQTDAPAAAISDSSASRLGPDGLTGEERERIRAWAVEEGIEVKTRGRLSKNLIGNYRSVHARR